VLLRAGEGELVSDSPGKDVRIKADRDELAVTESRYAPGERGPGDHIHREHADCFYVLEGTLRFELAGRPVDVQAGGFVLVPPELVHTFRNEGPAEARFLNIHAPGCRFADYLRGRYADFDAFDPPADGGRPASEALIHEPGAGETLALAGGGKLVLKATGDDALGSLTADEGFPTSAFPGVPAHRHRTFVDSFYVLEGSLAVRLGDETIEARAGDFALAVPGTVHGISIADGQPVRYLNLIAPGGFERFFREVEAAPPDPARLGEIASRYDVEAV
jgi:quercetin dioxygenase-like cupin family protein